MGDITAVPPDIVARPSLCFSQPMPGMVLHSGEAGFTETLLQHYSVAESNAAEELVKLKHGLRNADSERFWQLLTEGLANLADAQYAFVSKRILTNDKDVAVEMPPMGEPGACLMGAAFYINDASHGINTHLSNFKYHAYQCPCAYMKHDKIFIIPEKLNEFIVNNPNELVVPGEAYLGIPLFAEGKCFAHFGVMWSPKGAARRKLSWGYLEILFHGLEDLILDRVLQGDVFAKSAEEISSLAPRVVPHEAISIAQSLKPYARSLSHELRTPMQGVVGMLDVMMAHVKEAAEDTHHQPRIRKLLESLRANIETVQDSSRRAVEAADNVVHAYDMNMGMPETPLSPLDNTTPCYNDLIRTAQTNIPVTGNTLPLDQYRGTKRKATEAAAWSTKVRVSRPARQRIRSSFSREQAEPKSISTVLRQTTGIDTMDTTCSHGASSAPCSHDTTASPMFASEHSTIPGLRHTSLRDVVQYVINDALKVGGRPESAIAEETELGERIEVHTRSSSGQATTKHIEWTVSPDVPETILIEEKDLAKMISCVALNAIKFTGNGVITLRATLSPKGRYIVINVKDSGSGIPAAFLPNLFKPFSREDDSTTRQSEGLGLGLMVAKGLARKLGGDLFCLRSHVSGPDKGTEFEMRVPITPGEVCSRPATPFSSPSPSLTSRVSTEPEVPPRSMAQHPTTPPLSTEHKSLDSPAMTKLAPTVNTLGLPSPRSTSPTRGRAASRNRPFSNSDFDRKLARSYPANILIVDDNRINRHVLRHMLKNLGYTNIYEAYDGNNAVQQIHENAQGPAHEAINLVLMDLWMPLLDGFQATEQILKMQSLVEKPTILAVSADVTDAAIDRCGEVGMKGFLTKPFIIRDVEKLITQHCGAVVE
ncbi:sensor protein rcsC [Byssothecium circinans]|uniref:histidine kinase n=1 Tax=Byssothecium circinans TaxID=147558 RepID=A0A6A5TQ78_9PLEO|nr:sensor protein rcsC [Byssothecium circinans]